MDLAGVALVIGATTAGITAIGGFVLQILIFNRQANLHVLVNGQSEKLNAAVKSGAFAEGKEAGRDAQQALQAHDPRNGTA